MLKKKGQNTELNVTIECTTAGCSSWLRRLRSYHFVLLLVVGSHQDPFDVQGSTVLRGQREQAVQFDTLATGLLYERLPRGRDFQAGGQT